MLNRAKLLASLHDISDKLFMDNWSACAKAKELWALMVRDPLLLPKVRSVLDKAPCLLPTWYDNLDACFPVAQSLATYQVLAVDGSQIYPDRHQGTACFLLNVGSVYIAYGQQSTVHLDSTPCVYANIDNEVPDSVVETVNCRRQELEFVTGLELSRKYKNEQPFLFLVDGSLIFWHLESKDMTLKNEYLSKYIAVMLQLYQERTLMAGYISLPKNRELCNLLKLYAAQFDVEKMEAIKEFDTIVDTTIAHLFLQPYTRSTIFKNHSSICDSYPEFAHPHFFYLHNGHEIGRVEIPAWIAHDQKLVNLVANIIVDQSIKGRGYPVALAESHEQAVVKGPDREFFYTLIQKIGVDHKQRITMSQKSLKKRGIGI